MSHTVVCLVCESEDQRSVVYAHGGFMELLHFTPFYDEDGQYHSHDPNRQTLGYTCSRGHRFKRARYVPCPACGWVAGEETVTVLADATEGLMVSPKERRFDGAKGTQDERNGRASR